MHFGLRLGVSALQILFYITVNTHSLLHTSLIRTVFMYVCIKYRCACICDYSVQVCICIYVYNVQVYVCVCVCVCSVV